MDELNRTYTVRRGDAFVGEVFRLRAPAGVSFWDDWAAASQLRSSSDGALVHQFSLGGAVTNDAGTGVLTLTLSMTPEETEAIAPGNYVGDIEVESVGFPKKTPITFRLRVTPDVTRPIA